ncbi:hypothetical protein GQX74_005893 [Glossina fuscipes]|nr:hypothetical protein GQX74_005893 [Glossina fuscipes]
MTLQWTNICSLHIDEHWKFVKLKFIPHKQQHQNYLLRTKVVCPFSLKASDENISDLLLIYLHAEKEEILIYLKQQKQTIFLLEIYHEQARRPASIWGTTPSA